MKETIFINEEIIAYANLEYKFLGEILCKGGLTILMVTNPMCCRVLLFFSNTETVPVACAP